MAKRQVGNFEACVEDQRADYETTSTVSTIRTPIINPEQLRAGTRRGRKPVIRHHMTLRPYHWIRETSLRDFGRSILFWAGARCRSSSGCASHPKSLLRSLVRFYSSYGHAVSLDSVIEISIMLCRYCISLLVSTAVTARAENHDICVTFLASSIPRGFCASLRTLIYSSREMVSHLAL